MHGIYSNQPSFKRVEFDKGLNVVIAERKNLMRKKRRTAEENQHLLL